MPSTSVSYQSSMYSTSSHVILTLSVHLLFYTVLPGTKRKQDQMSPTTIPVTSPVHLNPIATLHHTTVPSRDLSPHLPVPVHHPTSHPGPSKGTRGVIVHPEFINFLIQPNIDIFKDIPRLPGQRDANPLPDHPREGWGESDSMDTNQHGMYIANISNP